MKDGLSEGELFAIGVKVFDECFSGELSALENDELLAKQLSKIGNGTLSEEPSRTHRPDACLYCIEAFQQAMIRAAAEMIHASQCERQHSSEPPKD